MPHKYFVSIVLVTVLLMLSANISVNNLSPNDKLLLAQSYYQVSLYYKSKGETQKANEFLAKAQSLDPHYADPISFTKGTVTGTVNKENALQKVTLFLPRFLNDKSIDAFISYPVYNIRAIELMDEKAFETFRSEVSKNYTLKNTKYSERLMSDLAQNIAFLPMIYENSDVIVTATNESGTSIHFLCRYFGEKVKIIGIYR